MAESTRYVGVRRPRIDARDKVLGATRYGGDLSLPGLLHARIVPSLYAHAMIRGIDVLIPGNIQSLTQDFFRRAALGNNNKGIAIQVVAGSEQRDVVFVGGPWRSSPRPSAAADAAALVEVDLAPLEPVIDVIVAFRGRRWPCHPPW
jgi:CO/xanthine dehydrogenase Mo-binding subunit